MYVGDTMTLHRSSNSSFFLQTFCILEGEDMERIRSVASGSFIVGAREVEVNWLCPVEISPGTAIFGSMFSKVVVWGEGEEYNSSLSFSMRSRRAYTSSSTLEGEVRYSPVFPPGSAIFSYCEMGLKIIRILLTVVSRICTLK